MKRFVSVLIAAAMVLGLMPVIALAENAKVELTPIHEINITGFRAPVAGETPEYSYFLTCDESLGYFIVYQYWYDNTLGQDMSNEQTPFHAGHQYSAGCLVCADEGYYIADDCVFMFNGSSELADPEHCVPHQYFEGDWYVQSAAVDCVESGDRPGDIDGNGAVEIADALLALRYAMGVLELTQEQIAAGDVNGNGVCSLTDAILIARFASGAITQFPGSAA